MKQYLDLLRNVLEHGNRREDRTGTGTLALFGEQLRCDLAAGFPLLTTKKIHTKSVWHELLWFLRGDTNLGYLHKHRVSIWNEWADDAGNLGPIYGKQWRSWPDANGKCHDQIKKLVSDIKKYPHSRSLIVSAWNVGQLQDMRLLPCHVLFQVWVNENKLSMQVYQRSADLFLGVPFNIASYSLLLHMLAQVTDLQVGEFVHVLGDAHIYLNHLEQAKLQLTRQPTNLPQIKLNPQVKDIFAFTYDDIKIEGYSPQPKISAPVAI